MCKLTGLCHCKIKKWSWIDVAQIGVPNRATNGWHVVNVGTEECFSFLFGNVVCLYLCFLTARNVMLSVVVVERSLSTWWKICISVFCPKSTVYQCYSTGCKDKVRAKVIPSTWLCIRVIVLSGNGSPLYKLRAGMIYSRNDALKEPQRTKLEGS